VSTILDTEIRQKKYVLTDEYEEDEQPGKPLYEYLQILIGIGGGLWKERRKLFFRTITLMALTLGYLLILPNRYTATATLTPPESARMSGLDMLIGAKTGMSQFASSSMGNMLGMRSPGQLYIQKMLSRPVQDGLIERFKLKDVYRIGSQESARKALTAATVAEEDRKTGAIHVSVTDKSPQRAAELANAYAEESGLLIARLSAESAKSEREYFERQLQQAKDELQRDMRELAAFGIKNGTIGTSADGSALVSAASAIEGEILTTEWELKGLLQIYTPQHERVLLLQAKLAELHRQLQQLKGKAPADASDGTNNLKDMMNVAPAYMELDRKVKAQEAVVEALAQQYELSKLQELHDVNSVQVFDPAEVPERKSAPHRATVTLLVGIVFFLGQCVFVIARDRWCSLLTDDPWRITLQPVVDRMSDTYVRAGRACTLQNYSFATRWRKRQPENHASAESDQQ
jgi:tyrosine-protein kinase Etk/Wzc